MGRDRGDHKGVHEGVSKRDRRVIRKVQCNGIQGKSRRKITTVSNATEMSGRIKTEKSIDPWTGREYEMENQATTNGVNAKMHIYTLFSQGPTWGQWLMKRMLRSPWEILKEVHETSSLIIRYFNQITWFCLTVPAYKIHSCHMCL